MFKWITPMKDDAEPTAEPREDTTANFDDPENASFETDSTPDGPSRFFDQVLVTGICLLILMAMAGMNQPWIKWAKGCIHQAFLASSETTFGYLAHWGPLQSLVQNGKNLIKLDEITKHLSSEATVPPQKQESRIFPFPNPVWPVQGSVSRSFGWQYNPSRKMREFNEGIEISAAPGSQVLALSGGQVTDVARRQDFSWQVSLSHGNGWTSVYRNLGLVGVKTGEQITPGAPLGSLNSFGPSGSRLWIQVKYNGQAVDPLTLFPN